MTHRILTLAAIALLSVPAAHAQGTSTGTPTTSRREQAMERREATAARRAAAAERRASMTPEQREAARARRAARANAMPEGQRQFQQDMRLYRQGLREKAADLRARVKAGSITGDDMASQLKAYRDANRPKNPAAAGRPSTGTP